MIGRFPFCVAAFLCIGMLPSSPLRAADSFPDDHGDTPAEASLIMPGGSPSNGVIEMDVDEDWFRFAALPGVSYRIEVTASSIWDTVLEMRAPDSLTSLTTTDSSRSSAPPQATVIWTNNGAAGTYYLGVSGYLKFTTGTYSIAVEPMNWTDSDHDGLPDSWEMDHLHTLAWGAADDPDGDGAGNLDEYYAMTDPDNSNSVLRITSVSVVPGGVCLAWPGAPYAGYRVVFADSLPACAWTALGTLYHISANTETQQWKDVSAGTARVYRVEQVLGF